MPSSPAFPNTVIRASAGTGKTFQLSNRFLGLAAAGRVPDDILSATFARKAAGEILDRVLTRLADAVLHPKDLARLARALEIEQLDQNRCGELLQDLIRRMHRLRIGTLDSFFVQLAGSFGLELGLPPGWRICDELIDQGLRADAIQEVLRTGETNAVVELMRLLNKGDLRRSITDQIFEIVQGLYPIYQDTSPDAWRSLNRKRELTADELTLAVEDLAAFEDFAGNTRFATAHRKDVEIARAANWEGFISSGLGKVVSSGDLTYFKKPVGPEIVSVYRPLVDHSQAILVNRIAHQTEASHRLLSQFDEAYQKLKQSRRALRFDDVTRSLTQGLQGIGAAQVSFRLDAHIAHLLLDEFQDTSLSQWAILRPVAEEIVQSTGQRSFFCVGDVKQAIYGWRGGVAAVFDAVSDALPGLTQLPLNESYRSSPPVIQTVNEVFGHLEKAPSLADSSAIIDSWKARFQKHSTARGELGGYCRMITAPSPAVWSASAQSTETLRRACAIVAELSRKHPERTIGVLARRNAVVARLAYELREHHRVAASEEGGNPLTDSTGVQLILSALSIADHPGDTAARFHVAHSPLSAEFGLTDWRNKDAAGRCSQQIRACLMSEGYGPTVYQWVRRLAPRLDERELSRMLQLVELAYRFEAQAEGRSDEFVRFVESTRVEDPNSANVRVMNIHQSKGLQFDIVVLPELDSKLTGKTPPVVIGRDEATGPIRRVCRYAPKEVQALLPSAFQEMFEQREFDVINEALCVFYVALTRAIHELHLVIAPPGANEKTLPATFAGLLRATLSSTPTPEPDSVIYEQGDPDWAKSPAEIPGTIPPESPAGDVKTPETIHVTLAPGRSFRHRGLKHESPSGREGAGVVSLARLIRADSQKAMSRGTLMHLWFEQVEWLDEGEPSDARLLQVARTAEFGSLGLEQQLVSFRAMLSRDAIRQALSRTAYAAGRKQSGTSWTAEIVRQVAAGKATLHVERERPFLLRDDETLLQGTLDRVVWCRVGDQNLAADILDFKTDAVDPDDRKSIDLAIEQYRPQLAAYRDAVCRISGLDPKRVTAKLLFVGCGLAEPV